MEKIKKEFEKKFYDDPNMVIGYNTGKELWKWIEEKLKAIQVQAKVSDDFCGHCMYLSLTEEEQTDKKEDHFCRLFHKRVLHFDKHPLLPRLDECMSIGKPSKNSR